MSKKSIGVRSRRVFMMGSVVPTLLAASSAQAGSLIEVQMSAASISCSEQQQAIAALVRKTEILWELLDAVDAHCRELRSGR